MASAAPVGWVRPTDWPPVPDDQPAPEPPAEVIPFPLDDLTTAPAPE